MSIIEKEVKTDLNEYHQKVQTYGLGNRLEGHEVGKVSHIEFTSNTLGTAHHHVSTNFPYYEDYTSASILFLNALFA